MKDKHIGFIQLIAVIGFIILSFAISFALKQDNKEPIISENKEIVLSVETQNITPQTHAIKFETTGIIVSKAAVSITPQISGKIIEINDNFFTGGNFIANDILFQIDPKDFELEVKRLEAQVASASTALQLETAEGDAAIKEWKQLRGKRDVPDLVARIPQLETAKANLKSAEAQFENAKLDLNRTSFRLPFDGRIISSTISIGQYVSVGQSYGSVFDKNGLEIKSSLNAQKLKWLLNGNKTDIKIAVKDLDTVKEFRGFLKRDAATLELKTRFATVHFGINGDISNILSGSFVKLEITGPQLNNVSIIPLSALQNDGLIWIADDENKLTSINPEIIHTNDERIIIQNLDKKSQVIISKLSGIVAGMSVHIIDKEQQE